MEHTLILRVARFVRRSLPLLLAGPVLGALAGYIVLHQIPPVYAGRLMLVVNPGTSVAGNSPDDLRGGELLAQTYAETIRTRPILEAAAQRAGVQASYQDLQRRVSVQPITNTQLIRITAEDGNPDVAARLANVTAEVFIASNLDAQASRFASSRENLQRLVDSARSDADRLAQELAQVQNQPSSPTRATDLARLQSEVAQAQATYNASVRSYEDLRIAEARSMNTLTVAEPAVTPDQPVRPQPLQTVVLAALVGAALATGLALLRQFIDDRVDDPEQVVTTTGVPVLGVIPRCDGEAELPDGVRQQFAESYRLALSNLVATTAALPPKTLLVVGTERRDGRSTVAANLAIVMAESGLRVVLVDADFRRPCQWELFDGSNQYGLSGLLRSPELAVSAVLQPTRVPGLQLVASGPTQADSSALLTSSRVADRLAELRQTCDVVVLDSPPILSSPDAVLLARRVDAAVLVVDAAVSRMRRVSLAVNLLRQAGATLVGVVVNRQGQISPASGTPSVAVEESPAVAEPVPTMRSEGSI